MNTFFRSGLLRFLLPMAVAMPALAGPNSPYWGLTTGSLNFDADFTGVPELQGEEISSHGMVIGLYGGIPIGEHFGMEFLARSSRDMTSDRRYHDSFLHQIAALPTLRWSPTSAVELFAQAGFSSAHYRMTLDQAPYYNDGFQWFGWGHIVRGGILFRPGGQWEWRLVMDYTSMDLEQTSIFFEHLFDPEAPDLDARWYNSSIELHYRY